MGYAEQTGFRAGTARAHKWFDLEENKTTDLTIHPFVYMDGTLNEYLNLSIQESKNRIQELFEEVKTYGGDFRLSGTIQPSVDKEYGMDGKKFWIMINLKSPNE